MKYILGIDQSTQGTKALIFDESGILRTRTDAPHRQKINDNGWVSHDPMEIYQNVISVVKELIDKSGISKSDIAAVGISNQRETTVAWDENGNAFADAIVWQCARAKDIAESLETYNTMIYERTGLPLSPFFPASKMSWFIDNVIDNRKYCMGTIDTWLIYKLTKGKSYKTDASNASRTQLFNLHTLSWDEELCDLFHVDVNQLPEVCDSNSCFGYTDFDGILDIPIPIHAVMGDSHSALYAQGCHKAGMVKATYGTGSSIMMNIGDSFQLSKNGLANSLAWKINGQAEYVLEGNINYTGAVISWMKDDVCLIQSTSEIEPLIHNALKEDTTVLIPAFSGLSAPYWNNGAKAAIYGMSRTTGRAELIKAAIESIAYQITDVLEAMKADTLLNISELRVDGGPTKNNYLMQFQADMVQSTVAVSQIEELSALGVVYMAGIAMEIYNPLKVFHNVEYKEFSPQMNVKERGKKLALWKDAVNRLIS